MKSLLTLSGLFLLSCTVGCAATDVTIPVWHAPQLDATGMRRIAAADLQGPAPYANQARDVLASELARQHYEVPDAATTRQLLPANVPYRGHNVDVNLLVQQARQAGFDGLLIGEVSCEGEADSSVRIGNPELKVAVQTQLIDVRTGNVRGAAKAHRSWQGRLSNRAEGKDSKRAVYSNLARAAAQETAKKLASATALIDVPLAPALQLDDGQAMKEGTEAARSNDWKTAAAHFEKARTANPDSHAAMYNLGLAGEAQRDFAAARHWYSAALRQHESATYRTALTRIDQNGRVQDIASQPQRIPDTQDLAAQGRYR